jgi:hypothetical protein
MDESRWWKCDKSPLPKDRTGRLAALGWTDECARPQVSISSF